MTVSLEQFPSQPVLVYRFEGNITLHDLMAVQISEQQYFVGLPAEARWHVIVDMSAIDTIAAPLFPKLQHMRLARDHHIGLMVVVGANPYLRALVNSLDAVVARHNTLFCATLDAALDTIHAYAPAIDAAPAPAPAVNARKES